MFGRGTAHGPENRSQLLDYMGQAEAHEHTYGIHNEIEIPLQWQDSKGLMESKLLYNFWTWRTDDRREGRNVWLCFFLQCGLVNRNFFLLNQF